MENGEAAPPNATAHNLAPVENPSPESHVAETAAPATSGSAPAETPAIDLSTQSAPTADQPSAPALSHIDASEESTQTTDAAATTAALAETAASAIDEATAPLSQTIPTAAEELEISPATTFDSVYRPASSTAEETLPTGSSDASESVGGVSHPSSAGSHKSREIVTEPTTKLNDLQLLPDPTTTLKPAEPLAPVGNASSDAGQTAAAAKTLTVETAPAPVSDAAPAATKTDAAENEAEADLSTLDPDHVRISYNPLINAR